MKSFLNSSRLFVFFVIAFATGILCVAKFNINYLSNSIIYIIGIIFSSLVLFCIGLFKHTFNKKVFFIFMFLIFFLAGMLRVAIFEYNQTKMLKKHIDKPLWIYGQVASVPEISSTKEFYTFILKTDKIISDKKEYKVRGNISVFVNSNKLHNLKFNSYIRFSSKLTPIKKNQYELFAKENGIFFNSSMTFFSVYPNYNFKTTFVEKIKNIGIQLKYYLTSEIDEIYDYNADANALVKGIMLGDTSGFSSLLRNSFSNAGLSHIVAVSGMHISILFICFVSILMFFRINKIFTYIIMIPILIMFAATSGFSPSVCRATLMLIVFILAYLMSREYDSLTSLFFAVLVILIVNPYTLFSYGFILSFCATLCIILYCPKLCTVMEPISEKFPLFGVYITKTICISFSAFVGTVYFTSVFFGNVSFSSILTNIWVIPCVEIIFIGGYLSCIIYPLFPIISKYIIRYFVAFFSDIVLKTVIFFGQQISLYIKYSMGLQHLPIYLLLILLFWLSLNVLNEHIKHKKIV